MTTSNKTEHRAFLVLLAFLVVVSLWLLFPFINAIILSMMLAVLCQPLYHLYVKWMRGRTNLASFTAVLSVVILLMLPFAILFPLITDQLATMVSSESANDTQMTDVIHQLPQKIGKLGQKVDNLLGLEMNLGPVLKKEMSQLATTLTKYSPKVITGTIDFFLHFFIMLILLFYFFRDGNKFVSTFIRITPVNDTYERKLASEIRKTIHSVFYGNFLTGLIQACLATLGFWALDIPGFLVWGTATFIMSFIPSVGTGVVIVPWIITLFAQGKMIQGIILTVYGVFIIGSVDNILRPYLIRQDMHPIIPFLSVFGGLTVFGPIGLLLGPMMMILLVATVKIYEQDFKRN